MTIKSFQFCVDRVEELVIVLEFCLPILDLTFEMKGLLSHKSLLLSEKQLSLRLLHSLVKKLSSPSPGIITEEQEELIQSQLNL